MSQKILDQNLRRASLVAASALSFAVLLLPAPPARAAGLTADDLVRLERVSDPQVSPDGETVVFVLRSTDMEADRGRTDLWQVGLNGEGLRRLTTHEAGDSNPRWAPDGESLYFLSSRSGSSQAWKLPADGGEAQRVTDLPLDVGNLEVSPTGTHLAFSLEVFTDCEDLDCTAKRLKDREKSKTTGQLYDSLFVRHWDTWKDGRRSHLFTLALEAEDVIPVDLTRGMDADVPSKPFGGSEEYTFSADGSEVVFTARTAGREEPWSTDFDLYRVPVDGSAAPENVTPDSDAWATHPVFSPDGETLAYAAMKRAGYEADRFRLVLRSWPDGEDRVLTEDWDRSAGSHFFSDDGETLYVIAQDTGHRPLFAVDVATGTPTKVVAEGTVRSAAQAGGRLVVALDHLRSPADLYTVGAGGGDLERITEVNAERLAGIDLGEAEQFHFAGWNGERVYGWVVKPAGFEKGKAYPVAFLIHGGPQGSFSNNFHYRWNPQSYAGAGYAAVMIDFHGSTGYGQAFTDSIAGDWGGKPLEDLQKGLAAAVELFPFLNGDKVCALGASYGGYMINWIAGNWPDRFRCLVNHDGVFDQRSMYFATEELWFPEWEHGGPYFANPEGFEKHNPALYVDRWKTPMLVVHGALDYRVTLDQGLGAFTALKRQGIPSRFLYFPDENHWVLKPHNSIQWHETVLEWLDRWLESTGGS